jgi:hypothetical protein
LNAKPIVLKALLQQRHMQTHSAFCREYDKVATGVDPTLKGGWPSRAQFYRWLSGDLIGLPYTDHCRILEKMFPGWKVDQLFQVRDGGIEFIPEPPTPQIKTATTLPTAPIAQEADQVVSVLSISWSSSVSISQLLSRHTRWFLGYLLPIRFKPRYTMPR